MVWHLVLWMEETWIPRTFPPLLGIIRLLLLLGDRPP